MTNEDIFNRPLLIKTKKDQLLDWLNGIRNLLSDHQTQTPVDETIWKVIEKSFDYGISLYRAVHCHDNNEINTYSVYLKTKPIYGFFDIDEDGDGLQREIEMLDELIYSLQDDAVNFNSIVGSAAHMMATCELRRNGRRLIAVDPITLKMLDRVSTEEHDRFHTEADGAYVWLDDVITGRGISHLQSKPFLKEMAKGMPQLAYPKLGTKRPGPNLKGDADPFGVFDVTLRNDVLNCRTQRHESGWVSEHSIFIPKDIPESVYVRLPEKLLDDVILTSATEGLGLKIEDVYRDAGTKSVAIVTDALSRLTILECDAF